MIKSGFSSLPLRQFSSLSSFQELRHYVSGKEGGVSKGEFTSLNLSYTVGDDPEAVKENRIRIQQTIEADQLVFPVQTHSANVVVIKTGAEETTDTDALVTNVPGVCISVMGADCVPILIYDPVKKAVAAIHSGWRGTVAGILSNAIRKMIEEYDSSPGDLMACIGPSISSKVYEVGPEVVQVVHDSFGKDSGIVTPTKENKGLLDLWKANRILLKNAGVKEEKIELAEICTYLNYSDFFSARKSGNKTGRFGAGIMIC